MKTFTVTMVVDIEAPTASAARAEAQFRLVYGTKTPALVDVVGVQFLDTTGGK